MLSLIILFLKEYYMNDVEEDNENQTKLKLKAIMSTEENSKDTSLSAYKKNRNKSNRKMSINSNFNIDRKVPRDIIKSLNKEMTSKEANNNEKDKDESENEDQIRDNDLAERLRTAKVLRSKSSMYLYSIPTENRFSILSRKQ